MKVTTTNLACEEGASVSTATGVTPATTAILRHKPKKLQLLINTDDGKSSSKVKNKAFDEGDNVE